MVSYSSRTAIGEGGVDSEPTHLAAAVRRSIEKQSVMHASPANLSQKAPVIYSFKTRNIIINRNFLQL